MTRLRQAAHGGALAATATRAAATLRRGRAGAMALAALAATAAMAAGSVAGAAPDPTGANSVSAEAVVGSVAVGDRLVEAAHRIPLARRDLAPGARQLVTVTSARFASTTATLRAWRRLPSGEWALAHGPVPAVIGYGGWVVATQRRQSTGTTPAGRFALPTAFGRLSDPGTRLPYRRVDGNDWWPYEPRDPATYNIYQRHRAPRTDWRRGFAEHLVGYPRQYSLAVVVGFNLPRGVHYSRSRRQWVATSPADTKRGGGIFLHVRGDGLTAGCVAMSRPEMRWLLRWLRPAAEPRVVMGPRRYVRTL
ncbi:MAG TPA: L,D-transpeptidase family protein [Nocardioidaceae bacterium]|nr:L,D-transpeptidase family protein [Nocardioidaceae bacterium]